jgi:hypothetical protein
MKRFGIVFIAFVFSFSYGPACLAAAPQPKVVIKMASIAPKGSNLATFFEEIGKQIREKTNNEVGLKLYWEESRETTRTCSARSSSASSTAGFPGAGPGAHRLRGEDNGDPLHVQELR